MLQVILRVNSGHFLIIKVYVRQEKTTLLNMHLTMYQWNTQNNLINVRKDINGNTVIIEIEEKD